MSLSKEETLDTFYDMCEAGSNATVNITVVQGKMGAPASASAKPAPKTPQAATDLQQGL